MDKELDLSSQRVCVTGGAGFLGKHLIEKLKAHGAKEIFVPTYPEYDLVREADILRMINDANFTRCYAAQNWRPCSSSVH